jgi:protein gp37
VPRSRSNWLWPRRFLSLEPLLSPLPSLDLTGIDWVIVGGESGRDHRPVDMAWVREIRDRCLAAGVPSFFKAKQAGASLTAGPGTNTPRQ